MQPFQKYLASHQEANSLIASTVEGGAGAQIRCIPEEQNNWQGTYWSSWLAEATGSGKLKSGGKFRVKLKFFDCDSLRKTRDLSKRGSPILSSNNKTTIISSSAFGNLSNGTNAIIIPLTPDPESGYVGKYTVDYSLTEGSLLSAYIMDDSGEPYETMASLPEGGSNTVTFNIEDEGSGNVWLLGWTKSETPRLNFSAKVPPAPTTTSPAHSSIALVSGTDGSGTAVTATPAPASSGATSRLDWLACVIAGLIHLVVG
ncbi:MAG: hypothetical protein Q9167_005445 [Letrouitia subvulpina]